MQTFQLGYSRVLLEKGLFRKPKESFRAFQVVDFFSFGTGLSLLLPLIYFELLLWEKGKGNAKEEGKSII